MRFEQDWAIPLAIIVIAVLAGLITWLATIPDPGHCRQVLVSSAGERHIALRCGPP